MSLEVEESLCLPGLELKESSTFKDVLITCATERDPKRLAELLKADVQNNPNVDWEVVQSAIDFGDEIHAGQSRKRDEPPTGVDKKPYTTHTLSTAILAAFILGEEATTTQVVAAVLHDSQEDGKINKGTQNERHITNEDIKERFGDDVAWTVDALSHVKEVPLQDGAIERVHLSKKEYEAQLIKAESERPEAGIFVIKYGGDANFNMVDPLVQLNPPVENDHPEIPGILYEKKVDTYSSRKRKIERAKKRTLSLVADNPVLQRAVASTIAIAEETIVPISSGNITRKHLPAVRAA